MDEPKITDAAFRVVYDPRKMPVPFAGWRARLKGYFYVFMSYVLTIALIGGLTTCSILRASYHPTN